MRDDPVLVKPSPPVRGLFPDTAAWLARYQQARHDITAAIRRVPSVVETFRQLAPGELYRIVWTPEMLTALREKSAVWSHNKDPETKPERSKRIHATNSSHPKE